MKKDIRIDLQEVLEPIYLENTDILTFLNPPQQDFSYQFLEIGKPSRFYFNVSLHPPKVVNRMPSGTKLQDLRTVTVRPVSPTDLTTTKHIVPVSSIGGLMEGWVKTVRALVDRPSIYDDPIEKAYADEFFFKVRSVDADANYAPFSPAQQTTLEQFLVLFEKVVQQDPELKAAGKTEQVVKAIEDLKNSLHKSPKNTVLRKIGAIAGTIAKHSKVAGKWAFEKCAGFFLNKALETAVKLGPEAIDWAKELGENIFESSQ